MKRFFILASAFLVLQLTAPLYSAHSAARMDESKRKPQFSLLALSQELDTQNDDDPAEIVALDIFNNAQDRDDAILFMDMENDPSRPDSTRTTQEIAQLRKLARAILRDNPTDDEKKTATLFLRYHTPNIPARKPAKPNTYQAFKNELDIQRDTIAFDDSLEPAEKLEQLEAFHQETVKKLKSVTATHGKTGKKDKSYTMLSEQKGALTRFVDELYQEVIALRKKVADALAQERQSGRPKTAPAAASLIRKKKEKPALTVKETEYKRMLSDIETAIENPVLSFEDFKAYVERSDLFAQCKSMLGHTGEQGMKLVEAVLHILVGHQEQVRKRHDVYSNIQAIKIPLPDAKIFLSVCAKLSDTPYTVALILEIYSGMTGPAQELYGYAKESMADPIGNFLEANARNIIDDLDEPSMMLDTADTLAKKKILEEQLENVFATLNNYFLGYSKNVRETSSKQILEVKEHSLVYNADGTLNKQASLKNLKNLTHLPQRLFIAFSLLQSYIRVFNDQTKNDKDNFDLILDALADDESLQFGEIPDGDIKRIASNTIAWLTASPTIAEREKVIDLLSNPALGRLLMHFEDKSLEDKKQVLQQATRLLEQYVTIHPHHRDALRGTKASLVWTDTWNPTVTDDERTLNNQLLLLQYLYQESIKRSMDIMRQEQEERQREEFYPAYASNLR